MADNPRKKKNIIPKPRGKRSNNQLWIFVLLALLVLSISFFTEQNEGVVITKKRFEDMVLSYDVKRIVVVTNQNSVEITLKAEALQNSKYKNEIEAPSLFTFDSGPHYVIKKILSAEAFYDDYKELISEVPESQRVEPEFTTRTTFP